MSSLTGLGAEPIIANLDLAIPSIRVSGQAEHTVVSSRVLGERSVAVGRKKTNWVATYRVGALLLDTVAAVAGYLIAVAGRLPLDTAVSGLEWLTYWGLGLFVVALFLTAVSFSGSLNKAVVGVGMKEYQNIVVATFVTFAILAIGSYMLQVDLSRQVFLVALPLVLVFTLAGRWVCRVILARARTRGEALVSTVVIGPAACVNDTVATLVSRRWLGYLPTGVCVVGSVDALAEPESMSGSQQKLTQLERLGIQDVIDRVASGEVGAVVLDGVSRDYVRTLSWKLEPYDVDYLVSPVTADVSPDRVHTRMVAGARFVHLDLPSFTGGQYVVKRAFDIVFSLAFLVVFSWLFALIALLIWLGHDGPILFRQERVGHDGKRFLMNKFRTMTVDAEAQLDQLKAETEDQRSSGLFKLENDPRVTKIGRVLRKWSLDELPQFWNVLRGDMSVVGPRPCLPRELEMYGNHHYRRFFVKPGITGQWQVEGRSDTSLEDYFRLDLSYVDNWSLVGDGLLVLRTVKAVVTGSGAY